MVTEQCCAANSKVKSRTTSRASYRRAPHPHIVLFLLMLMLGVNKSRRAPHSHIVLFLLMLMLTIKKIGRAPHPHIL
jgi:hypothetical protein